MTAAPVAIVSGSLPHLLRAGCHALRVARAYWPEGADCAVEVKLQPVYESGDDGNAVEENRIFGKATPAGQIGMQLLSRAAADRFEVGRSYYVEFTPAEN